MFQKGHSILAASALTSVTKCKSCPAGSTKCQICQRLTGKRWTKQVNEDIKHPGVQEWVLRGGEEAKQDQHTPLQPSSSFVSLPGDRSKFIRQWRAAKLDGRKGCTLFTTKGCKDLAFGKTEKPFVSIVVFKPCAFSWPNLVILMLKTYQSVAKIYKSTRITTLLSRLILLDVRPPKSFHQCVSENVCKVNKTPTGFLTESLKPNSSLNHPNSLTRHSLWILAGPKN